MRFPSDPRTPSARFPILGSGTGSSGFRSMRSGRGFWDAPQVQKAAGEGWAPGRAAGLRGPEAAAALGEAPRGARPRKVMNVRSNVEPRGRCGRILDPLGGGWGLWYPATSGAAEWLPFSQSHS